MQVPRKRVVAVTVTQSENMFLLRDRVSNQLQQQGRKKDRIQVHRQRKTTLWNGNKFVIVVPFLRQRRNHRATVRNRLRMKLVVTFLIVREARNTVVSFCRQRKSCRATVISIGSIEEDFNYSINRFCNYEPESSTCRIRNVSSSDHHDNADGVNYFASSARSPRSSSVRSDEGTCKQFIAAVLEAAKDILIF